MKKTIVITSVYPPTEAVRAFAQAANHDLIVVGDKKTPPNWACEGVEFLSVEQQETSPHSLARHLPFNHYCRKMLGYLRAIERGADVVIDTDDDNIPKSDWSFPDFDGIFDRSPGGMGFVNIYQLFTSQHIWPRGLPLDLILKRFDLGNVVAPEPCRVGVWQGLADEDPDVDAIYRLTSDIPCYFQKRDPVVLDTGTICPFNSQNTATRRRLFALLYMPVFVTFRFTDILRGLVAQPIMAAHGYQLGFVGATVVQKRNPHDYMKDFVSEIPVYEHSRRVIESVSKAVSPHHTIEGNMLAAYQALCSNGIVPEKELVALQAWLSDLKNISP
jgi:hypothetical protein